MNIQPYWAIVIVTSQDKAVVEKRDREKGDLIEDFGPLNSHQAHALAGLLLEGDELCTGLKIVIEGIQSRNQPAQSPDDRKKARDIVRVHGGNPAAALFDDADFRKEHREKIDRPIAA